MDNNIGVLKDTITDKVCSLKTENGVRVKVTLVSGRTFVKKASLKTIHLKAKTKGMSDAGFYKHLYAGHSPIRMFKMYIDIDFISDRVHTHFVRHRGANWFVSTLRDDLIRLLGVSLNEEQRGGVRTMSCDVNAEVLLHMAKQRLCCRAWKHTRMVMELIKESIGEIDSAMSEMMQPPCVWYGFCSETDKCCGWDKTPTYAYERTRFVDRAKRLEKGEEIEGGVSHE